MAHLNTAPRFDRVARIYRAMEFLSFGPLLERCRFFHLPQLDRARRALVLGDGDGRFLARLLSVNREIHADAVDASPAMLRHLNARVAQAQARSRVTTTCSDIRGFEPTRSGYDLVATHFFLDCLTPAETAALIARTQRHLAPNAQWVVSEFDVPGRGRFRAGVSRAIIGALYAAFRLLTGLTVRAIPPWRDLLAQAGFACRSSHTWLGGLLVSEVWELRQTTAGPSKDSHEEVLTHRKSATQLCSLSALTFGAIPGIDPGPMPAPDPPAVPEPVPAPGPAPDPDPMPYPGPIPAPQPVTRSADPATGGIHPEFSMTLESPVQASPHRRRCRPILHARVRRRQTIR